jgi:hypothetical protein
MLVRREVVHEPKFVAARHISRVSVCSCRFTVAPLSELELLNTRTASRLCGSRWDVVLATRRRGIRRSGLVNDDAVTRTMLD